MSLITYPTGVLIKPIGETWGWSRGETTLLLSLHSLMTLVLGPLAGMLVRRTGAWRLSLVALPAAAACMAFGIAHAGPHLGAWYLSWALFGLAQLGCTVIVWAYAVTVSFDRSRGLALAIAMCGSGAAASIMPPLTLALFKSGGISRAYEGLALLMIVTLVPFLVAGLWRERRQTRHAVVTKHVRGPGMTLREGVRGRTFWQLGIGMMICAGGVSAMIIHVQALFTDRGLTMAQAAWAMVLLGPSLVAGRLIIGGLLDRLGAGQVMMLVFAFPILGCAMLAMFNGTMSMAIAIIVCAGVAAGDMLAYFVSRYFGTAHFGAIYALMLGLFGIGYGAAPAIAGYLFDSLGSYSVAFSLFGVALVLGAICLGLPGAYPLVYAPKPSLPGDVRPPL